MVRFQQQTFRSYFNLFSSRRVPSLAYWIESSSKSIFCAVSRTWNSSRSRFKDVFTIRSQCVYVSATKHNVLLVCLSRNRLIAMLCQHFRIQLGRESEVSSDLPNYVTPRSITFKIGQKLRACSKKESGIVFWPAITFISTRFQIIHYVIVCGQIDYRLTDATIDYTFLRF